jgi:hypothetical protein
MSRPMRPQMQHNKHKPEEGSGLMESLAGPPL